MNNDKKIIYDNFKIIYEEKKSSFQNYYLEIMKSAFHQYCNIMNIEMSEISKKKICIRFTKDKNSCVENGIIFLGEKNFKKDSAIENYFELIFRHELVHWLVEFGWGGNTLALFNEGLPIFLADNYIREKELFVTYHEISKALLLCNKLIPISNLINGSSYHQNRGDWRVDVQAGSFTGYIFQSFPLEIFKKLFTKYKSPTNKRPYVKLNDLLINSLGVNLSNLEANWHSFLKNDVSHNLIAKNKANMTTSIDKIMHKTYHCQFCYYPISKPKEICPSCKQNNSIEVSILL